MDIYNTVWLSDFESVHSCGTRSGFSSLNQSRATFPANNLGHSTPRNYTHDNVHNDDRCHNRVTSKNRLHRTLSLPESDLATLNGDDLQERFARLQIEQENRELRMLVRQLQEALEKLEKAMVNNLTKNAVALNPTCSTCSSCTEKKLENKIKLSKSLTNKPAPVHSPDSLEENNSKSGSEKDLDKFKGNESGYHTLTNDTLGHDDPSGKDNGDFKLKEYQYMEYSDSMSYSSEEERQYFESRLAKKRGYYDDFDEDSRCCIVQ